MSHVTDKIYSIWKPYNFWGFKWFVYLNYISEKKREALQTCRISEKLKEDKEPLWIRNTHLKGKYASTWALIPGFQGDPGWVMDI